MARCEQVFENPTIAPEAIPDTILEQLHRGGYDALVKPDMSVAILCASRGIHNIAIIIKIIVDFCKSRGAQPFVFPAMGSHGGATAGGQLEIVNGLGVTE